MKWFMSYIEVWDDGRHRFGSCDTTINKEHPIKTILRWNEDYGTKEQKRYVLLSFCEVDDELPEMDILTQGIGP